MKIIHTGLAFRADVSGKKTSIRIQDVEGARWMKVARGWQMKLELKSGGEGEQPHALTFLL
jgi:hypothetical protein